MRAGKVAVKSGVTEKTMLAMSAGRSSFAAVSQRSSSSVASKMAISVLSAAVVAPRIPRTGIDSPPLGDETF